MAIYQRKLIQTAVHQRLALLKELAPILRYAGPDNPKRKQINRGRVRDRRRLKNEIAALEMTIVTEVTKDVLQFARDWPLEKRRKIQQDKRAVLKAGKHRDQGLHEFETVEEVNARARRVNAILKRSKKSKRKQHD